MFYKKARNILLATLAVYLIYLGIFQYEFESSHRVYLKSSNDAPFIFIGGYPRSGTTLMRAILDVHPNIKCGPETIIIFRYLQWIMKYHNNIHIKNAGIARTLLDQASADFIARIMIDRGFNVTRLCAKDPETLTYINLLHTLFPKAKFIYMIRDGRASAYSHFQHLFSDRSIKRLGYSNSTLYSKCLHKWNDFNRVASYECSKIGKSFCLAIRYEDLVKDTEKVLKVMIEFLGEKWHPEMLHHQEHIGDSVILAKAEWSSDQVAKPIYTEALDSWIEKITIKKKDLKLIEPLLLKYGYQVDLPGIKIIDEK